jgi:hypothetical protein
MGKTQTVNVTCGKCDGKGQLFWLGHIENGRCFACGGVGTVKCQPVTVQNAAKCAASYDLAALTQDDYGQPLTDIDYTSDWAANMINRAAKNMLVASDTAWSRKHLDSCPAELRALLIAAGRSLKAAK